MRHELLGDVMPTDDIYAFDITLHGRTPGLVGLQAVDTHTDAWGAWPTLAVPRDLLAMPMPTGFDEALERLSGLERMYAEPDGSFVWTSPREGLCWRISKGVALRPISIGCWRHSAGRSR